MSISNEIERLGDLHRNGVLSDEEFSRAKARVLGTASPGRAGEAPVVSALNALRRSREERWLGGVSGGISQMTGLATWVWRLIFVLLAMAGGTGVVIYVLLWILLPEQELPIYRSPNGGSDGNLNASSS